MARLIFLFLPLLASCGDRHPPDHWHLLSGGFYIDSSRIDEHDDGAVAWIREQHDSLFQDVEADIRKVDIRCSERTYRTILITQLINGEIMPGWKPKFIRGYQHIDKLDSPIGMALQYVCAKNVLAQYSTK